MLASIDSVEEHPVDKLAFDSVWRTIPPLWPLQNFVAVNPFLGLSGMPFEQAARLMDTVAHSGILMSSAYYLEQLRNGDISPRDIRAALSELGSEVEPADPVSWLEACLRNGDPTHGILTVADWLDQNQGSGWRAFIVDEISKWCSSYFDAGQCSWAMPWKDLPLYQAWKRVAAVDANAEIFGLAGFRDHVKRLPDSEDAAIEYALRVLRVPPDLTGPFLHRQLMSVFGWSAFSAFHDRQKSSQDHLRQLLAVRLAYDTALLSVDETWACQLTDVKSDSGFSEAKHIAQLAMEHAYRSSLVRKLRAAPVAVGESTRKSLQAVFCIDVRSEVYRRALEAQSTDIETLGFAGFFGMPVDVSGSARCPVLIAPRHQVHADRKHSSFFERGAAIWKSLSSSASSCFSTVEVGGAWFGLRLLQGMLPYGGKQAPAENLHWHIPLSERVDLVAGALRNMSIDVGSLARVVLICGHGSRTENNPYGSSLDCGACGGNKGDINARFAAALLNDPEVRKGLEKRGILLPPDTVFIAGLHVTTTDEVVLYDSERVLSTPQRIEIERWLEAASRSARIERLRTLAPCNRQELGNRADREVERRSRDWSEVRPEWGLARNAAFIAAPRTRTRHLNLDGRVFLHEYNQDTDLDATILQMILTAPVIVASWINLQYYGSTVNNQIFGSGNKVIHNVVGTFGIWEGNGGDLRTGLPLQSLHDGDQWVHEPLRLQVFIEAPRKQIDKVLRANPEVRNLVENKWLRLMSMEGAAIYEYEGSATWLLAGAGREREGVPTGATFE